MPQIFALPTEEKNKVAMLNSPHFLGYTGLGTETTADHADFREVSCEMRKTLVIAIDHDSAIRFRNGLQAMGYSNALLAETRGSKSVPQR